MIRDLLVLFLIPSLAFASLDNPASLRIRSYIAKYKTSKSMFIDIKPVDKVKKISVPPRTPVSIIDLPEVVSKNSIFSIIEKEAPVAGIHPLVIYAIQQHETGCYRSSLWRRAKNPGGIKYRRFDFPTGRAGVYSSFNSIEDGIKAHILVLANSRYSAARKTNDLEQQVVAIARGGYAEYSPSWTSQVRKRVRMLSSRTKRGMMVD